MLVKSTNRDFQAILLSTSKKGRKEALNFHAFRAVQKKHKPKPTDKGMNEEALQDDVKND